MDFKIVHASLKMQKSCHKTCTGQLNQLMKDTEWEEEENVATLGF